jgi:hypothetical protein
VDDPVARVAIAADMMRREHHHGTNEERRRTALAVQALLRRMNGQSVYTLAIP